jgi:hypothetical protein
MGWRFSSIASMVWTTCFKVREASRLPDRLRRSLRAFFPMVSFVGLLGWQA